MPDAKLATLSCAPGTAARDSLSFALSDTGNAERVAAYCGSEFRFCGGAGGWWRWTGTHWGFDETRAVERAVKEVLRGIAEEARDEADDAQRAKIFSWAGKCESERARKAALRLAECESAVAPADFDSSPELLNGLNGTVDLYEMQDRSGLTIRAHRRSDMQTRVVQARFLAEAEAPIWCAFINQLVGGDDALRRFLQRALGYSLLGSNPDRKFFVLHGPAGGEGKSLLLQGIAQLLGGYATTIGIDAFCERRSGGASPEIARLAGVRFLQMTEAGQGTRIDPALVKRLTGNDAILARGLYKAPLEFVPQFVPWLATNEMPAVGGGGDPAFWGRLSVIPCPPPLPGRKRRPARDMLAEFAREADGILQWMMNGLAAYFANGLAPPNAVTQAVLDYQSDADVLARFFETEIVLEVGTKVDRKLLYGRYMEWAAGEGIRNPMDARAFGNRVARLPRVWRDAGKRHFLNVRLRDSAT